MDKLSAWSLALSGIILAFVAGGYLLFVKQYSVGPMATSYVAPDKEEVFPLDDKSAKYYIIGHSIFYAIGGKVRSVPISNLSTVEVKEYNRRDVIVEGEFVAEAGWPIVCLIPPCGIQYITRIKITKAEIKGLHMISDETSLPPWDKDAPPVPWEYSGEFWGFSLSYPASLLRSTALLAGYRLHSNDGTLSFPSNAFPGTNFIQAGLMVSHSIMAKEVDTCLLNDITDARVNPDSLRNTRNINGRIFHWGTFTRKEDFGSNYSYRIYRNLAVNTKLKNVEQCTEIFLLVSTDDTRYYPEGTVIFDEEIAFSMLDQILSTFKFTK